MALTFWWRLRGLLRAGERGFTRALEAADPTPSSLRAYALWGGGYLAVFLGDFAAAFARFEEARAVAEEVGDQAALARALGGQGFLRLLRDPAGARQAPGAGLPSRSRQRRSLGHDVCQAEHRVVAHPLRTAGCRASRSLRKRSR